MPLVLPELCGVSLKNALSIWQSCENCQEEIAMAHDHLGYVLTDSPETYELAKKHLTKALYERDRFAKSNPTPSNRYAFSTTCDNLGYLLYKSSDEIDEAMQLLKKHSQYGMIYTEHQVNMLRMLLGLYLI